MPPSRSRADGLAPQSSPSRGLEGTNVTLCIVGSADRRTVKRLQLWNWPLWLRAECQCYNVIHLEQKGKAKTK